MEKKTGLTAVRILVVITFLLMVATNAAANILPINGKNTGQISDAYQNLFAPAGITFAIWGVIYLLLALYTFYQIFFYKNSDKIVKTGVLFSISSIANTAWIFAWHYEIIPLTMILIVVVLVCLILINQDLHEESFIVRVPFSVYFGWATVATIANATVLLVSLGWNGFGVTEDKWAIAIIVVGMIIGTVTMLMNKDIAYGLVLIWAYLGIFIKHTSESGFNGEYTSVIGTVVGCIVIFVASVLYVVVTLVKLKKKS